MLTLTKFWIWLTTAVEPSAAWTVYSHFGSPEKAYFADAGEYNTIEGLNEGQRAALRDKTTHRTERILRDCDRLGVRILTWQDADYPDRLREMEVPPLVLYLRGKTLRLEEECIIGMAGTRRCSGYGQKMAERFAYELTKQGALVLTGVAEGCDLAALHGAMQAGGPVGVLLVGGVDVPFVANAYYQQLYYDIMRFGTLISPYPPATPNNHRNFFYRNAILTALSTAVFVVEAGSRSGTLNVAMHAQEQDRPLYTIPANLDIPSAAGTNGLLCSGLALPVCCAEDLLLPFQAHFLQLKVHKAAQEQRRLTESVCSKPAAQPVTDKLAKEKPTEKEMQKMADNTAEKTAEKENLTANAPKGVDSREKSDYIDLQTTKEQFSQEECAILKALQVGSLNADDLSAETSLSASQVLVALTTLTIGDWVEEKSGGYYSLKRSEAC